MAREKTIPIESLANQNPKEKDIKNMDKKLDISTQQNKCKGNHKCKRCHILCFEDFDSCVSMIHQKEDSILFLIKESDELIVTPKRIMFITFNKNFFGRL